MNHIRKCGCRCGCRRSVIVRPPSIWAVCRDCLGHLIRSTPVEPNGQRPVA